MKSSIPTVLLVFASSPLLFGQTAPEIQTPPVTSPATSDSAVVQMSPFEVNASKEDIGYRAANSVSATRISTKISDLPFAISALTPEFIMDTNSTDLFDAVRYSAGVTNGSQGFNKGADWFTVRGFPQPAEHDGFYESSQGNVYIDTVNVERVEVVKGPASLLYGQISPGGTVNYITKRPQTRAFASVTVSGGSYDYRRTTIDVNQPLIGNTLLFRFNGAYQNAFEYQTLSKTQMGVFVPTLTWNLTPKLAFKVSYQNFQRRETPPANLIPAMEVCTPVSMANAFKAASGYPAPAAALVGKTGVDAAAGYNDAGDPGWALHFPALTGRFNSSGAHDWRKADLETLNAEMDLTLGSHWNGRANYNYNFNRVPQYQVGVANQIDVAPPNSLIYSNGTWTVAPSWNQMTSAQQLAAELAFAQQLNANPNIALQTQNGTPPPALQGRRPRLQELWGSNKTVQVEMAGDYEFPWGKIKPLFGLFYDSAYNANRIHQSPGNAANPNYHIWDVNPASPTFYINQYDSPSLDLAKLTQLNTWTNQFTSDQAAYGIVNASFFEDRLQIMAGLRYNRSQSQTTNFVVSSGTNPLGQGYKTQYTTPQIGIGYKIKPGVMLYASYSEAYTLPAQAFLRTIQNINGVLANVPSGQAQPTTGKGYEVGLKTDLRGGRISTTLAAYEITEVNIVQTFNQIINGANYGIDAQGNEVRGRGIEYEFTLTPTTNWQIFGSVAEEDVRNTTEPVGFLYYLGAHPQQTTKTLANLWTRYTVSHGRFKGVWLGGGFNYVGRSAMDNRNPDLFQPAYTLWNSALGYDWKWGKTNMSVTANWQNMSNVFYVPVQAVSGLPERVVVSMTARF